MWLCRRPLGPSPSFPVAFSSKQQNTGDWGRTRVLRRGFGADDMAMGRRRRPAQRAGERREKIKTELIDQAADRNRRRRRREMHADMMTQ